MGRCTVRALTAAAKLCLTLIDRSDIMRGDRPVAPLRALQPMPPFPERREVLEQSGEIAPTLLSTAAELDAKVLVAGAYGHTRLKEFIFGGATRTLLGSDGPSLFLSH